jgi:apolipoprotein D and lipocalin family protein
MGPWFVIASIPTFIEKDAYNAVESYRLDTDGTVRTTFRFNKGSLNGPIKEYTPLGFIQDPNPMPCGACNLSGPSKQNTALSI